MRSDGRRAPGLLSALRSFFKPESQKRKELKEKKKKKEDKQKQKGYGGETIVRSSHIASRRYSRIRCSR